MVGLWAPQPGSTDFPNWKKKWDAGRRGQGEGCIFLVFFLGPDSSSNAHQMEKGSQSTPCVLGQAPAAGLAATGANWGSFPLVQREWRGPRHPQLAQEHPACCRHGGPIPGCCGLAVPEASTAALVGTVSAGISGGISAPGGSRSCKGERGKVLLRWPTLCRCLSPAGSSIAQPLPAGCWPGRMAASGIYGGLLEWG